MLDASAGGFRQARVGEQHVQHRQDSGASPAAPSCRAASKSSERRLNSNGGYATPTVCRVAELLSTSEYSVADHGTDDHGRVDHSRMQEPSPGRNFDLPGLSKICCDAQAVSNCWQKGYDDY